MGKKTKEKGQELPDYMAGSSSVKTKEEGAFKSALGDLKRLILGPDPDEEEEEETTDLNEYISDSDEGERLSEKRKKQSYGKRIITCFKKDKALFFTNVYFIIVALNILFLVMSDISLIVFQKRLFLYCSMFTTVAWIFSGVCVWLYASDREFYVFLAPKLLTAWLVILHAYVLLLQPFFLYVADVAMPGIMKLKTGEFFTPGMHREMVAYVAILLPAVFGAVVYNMLMPSVRDMVNYLSSFKLSYAIDRREFAETSYDQTIIKDLRTGKPLSVYEKDRFLGTNVVGSSGTAKTSSLMLPGICQDLDHKIRNDIARQRELAKFVQDKKGYILLPPGTASGTPFHNEWVVPKNKHKKEYEYILRRYQSCGIIVLAPDDEFCDQVAELCLARKIKPKYLDPTLVYSGGVKSERIQKYEPYLCGLNMFHIPEGMSLGEEADYVARTSFSFGSIIQAVSEKRKSGDEYFSNVTKTVAQTAAMIEMLYYKYCAKVPRDATFHDVAAACNNFRVIALHSEKLEKVFSNEEDAKYRLSDVPSYETIFKSVRANFAVTKDIRGVEKKTKFDENASGLRMALQELEASPGVNALFSSENTLNIDESLKNGDVLIVNFPLSISETAAVGWGLAFQLTLKEAITRRDTRDGKSIPVFEYIDELASIAGEWFGTFIQLARKYSLGFIGALQSADQLDRSENTRFLKQIVTSVGTQYVYGRASLTEMELYSELSGTKTVSQTMMSKNYTSFLSSETRESLTERIEESEELQMSKADIRFTGFQELTFLQSKNGHILRGVRAKSSFLPKDAFKPVNVPSFDWVRFAKDYAPEEAQIAGAIEAQQMLQEKQLEQPKEYPSEILSVNRIHPAADTDPALVVGTYKLKPKKEETDVSESIPEAPASHVPEEEFTTVEGTEMLPTESDYEDDDGFYDEEESNKEASEKDDTDGVIDSIDDLW